MMASLPVLADFIRATKVQRHQKPPMYFHAAPPAGIVFSWQQILADDRGSV